MAQKTKNHFIPNFIINNFSRIDKKHVSRISFLQKSTKIIKSHVPSKDQCQKRYFYSKEKINILLNKFKHVTLNSIFSDINKTLEENLDGSLETKFGKICTDLQNQSISEQYLINNQDFIKEYFVIQFLRTTKFKESVEEIKNNQKFDTVEFNKQLKENIVNNSLFPPELVRTLLNTPRYAKSIEHHTKIAENNFIDYRDFEDKHTIEILSIHARDNFFKFYDLQNTKITLLQNKTNIPFILSDWGVLVTKVLCEYPDGHKTEEYEFYLSVSPELSILFSKRNSVIEMVSEDYVQEINQLLYEECCDIVYSSEVIYLKKFILGITV